MIQARRPSRSAARWSFTSCLTAMLRGQKRRQSRKSLLGTTPGAALQAIEQLEERTLLSAINQFRPETGVYESTRDAGVLSEASSESVETVASDYLDTLAAENGWSAAYRDSLQLETVAVNPGGDTTNVVFRQQVGELRIPDSMVTVTVDTDGQVVRFGSKTYTGSLEGIETEPAISPVAAVSSMAAQLGWSTASLPTIDSTSNQGNRETILSSSDLSDQPITARLTLVPTTEGLVLAWQVEVDGAHGEVTGQVNAADGILLQAIQRPHEGGDGSGSGSGGGPAAAPPFPTSDTFTLNSRPGARHVIYLDFDGHVTSNTDWNLAFTSGADIVTPPLDIDNSPTTFSAEEHELIQNAFLQVAEDFAPFDVNVTTEEPPINDLLQSGPFDRRWGVRVAIGGSFSDWFGSAAGGVAYLGSFTYDSDTPAFVFFENTSQSFRGVAETISHEAGHTLGLSHDGTDDGTTQVEYYTGHNGWAPIMGFAGDAIEFSQFSQGEYQNADNQEDDLDIIATQNGFDYRIDQHGDILATATTMLVDGVDVSIDGVIETRQDVDLLEFQTGTGPVSFTISTPMGTDGRHISNLLFEASLLDDTGAVLQTVTSSGVDNSATISDNLPLGTYFLSIEGIGRLTPSTGFSDYGSIGQYTVSGTITPLLQLSVSRSTFAENAGNTAAIGSVTVLGRALDAGDLTVDLITDDPSELAVPAQVTIPNGSDRVTFSIDAVDDDLLDGTQIANVIASAGSIEPVSVAISVTDHETLTLDIAADQIFENAGPGATTMTLTRSNTDTQPASILTVAGNQILEYDRSGNLLNTIDIENPDGGYAPGEVARDVFVLPNGRVAIFNGTETVYLSQYDRSSGFWNHIPIPGISTDFLESTGGITASGFFAYLTDMATPAGPSTGMVRVNLLNGATTRFADQEFGSRLFASSISQGIIEIDPATGEVLNSFAAPGFPGVSDGLAFDGQNLWFIPHQVSTSNLYQLDPDTGAVIDIHDPPGTEVFDGLAYLNGLIYLNSFFTDDVIAYDPITRAVDHIVNVPGDAFFGGQGALAAITGPDALLVSDSLSREVWEVDPVTGFHNRTWFHDFAFTDLGLATVDGEIYVAMNTSNEIKIYDRTGIYQRSINVPGSIGMQSLGGDDVQGLVPSTREYIDNTVGYDGRIYGLTDDHVTVGVFDRLTLNLVDFVTLDSPVNAIAVDSLGNIYGVDDAGFLTQFSPAGVTQKSLDTGVTNLIDLDLSLNNEFLASSSGGEIVKSTTALNSSSSFSGAALNTFVTFSDYQGRNQGDLVVTLINSDPTEISIPTSVIIPAGEQSITIPVDAVDDFLFDGDQIVIVTPQVGTVGSYEITNDSIEVLDAENLILTVSKSTMNESETITGTIARENADGVYSYRNTVSYANNTAIPIPDQGKIVSDIVVSDLAAEIADLDVTLNIAHTWNADLDVFLIAPDGQRLKLFTDIGLDGNNFTNTVLDDEALGRVIDGSAPFTGRFRPFEPLSTLDGISPNGTWSLEISDDNENNVGTLLNWKLDMTLLGLAPIAVNLQNSDPTELNVPSQVVIPANKLAANFAISGVIDNTIDPTQLVTITAIFPGYSNTPSQTISVKNGEQPVLTSPGEVSPSSPLFTWNAVDNAQYYDLWIDNLTTGEREIYRNRYLTGTSFQLPFSLPNGQYEAWLIAYSPTRDRTLWSDSIVFNTVARPGQVDMIAPRTNISSTLPEFVWSTDPSASHYEVWVRNITTGQDQILHETMLVGSSWTPTSGDVNYGLTQLPQGRYRSWVRAFNVIGQSSAWSDYSEWFIVADVAAPTTPSLLSPNFATSNRRPTFQWTAVNNAYYYDLWVRNLTTGTDQYIRQREIVGTSFTPSFDMVNANYRFWVRATNEEGESSAWSSEMRFSVMDDVPAPVGPTITAPVFLAGASPLVKWTASQFAVSYELQINDITFNRTNVVRVSNIPTNQYQVNTVLRVALYQARVAAVNSEGEVGAWGAWHNFLVTDADLQPNSPSPGDQQPELQQAAPLESNQLELVAIATTTDQFEVTTPADSKTRSEPARTAAQAAPAATTDAAATEATELLAAAWNDQSWWSAGFDADRIDQEAANELAEMVEEPIAFESESSNALAFAPVIVGSAMARLRRWRNRRQQKQS